jgi:hypothetical protein
MGATCFGADQPNYFNMTETLNAQWNERIQASMKMLQEDELARRTEASKLIGGHRSPSITSSYRSLLPIPILEPVWPARSKHLLPDDPVQVLTTAFLGCTRLRILTVDTTGPVAPHLVEILKDNLHEEFLVQKQVITSDAFAMRILYQLLNEVLEPDEEVIWYSNETTASEVKEYRQNNRFEPSIVLFFNGKNGLQIDLDTKQRHALIRTNDKWGGYTFDKLSAMAIEARVKDLQTLYANNPIEQTESP